MKKVGKAKAIIIAILVIIIVLEALAFTDVIKLPWPKSSRIISQGDPTTTNEVVEESLVGIGELYTMEYSYTMQSTTTNPIEVFGIEMPLGENKLSYLYSGALQVGVDLEQAKTTMAGKVITVTFPELIAENTYDENSVEFYDVKQHWFNKQALENYQASRIANLNDIKKRAEELGIYDKAKDNLKDILQNQFNAVLKQVGKGEDYTVNIVIESDDVNYKYGDDKE